MSSEEVLAFFDREYGEALAAALEDLIALAKRGDRWVLAQLHLRSLEDPRYARRLEQEPELMAEIVQIRRKNER